jgi:hypothetical protein
MAYFIWIYYLPFRALPSARVFRCIFFPKKDAAVPANAGMAVNKVRRSAAGFTAHPIYRLRNKRPPHPVSLVARTLRCWSTRPPVLRQALVFLA